MEVQKYFYYRVDIYSVNLVLTPPPPPPPSPANHTTQHFLSQGTEKLN